MAEGSQNSRTRTQQDPPRFGLRKSVVTPTSSHVTGWDILGGIVHYVVRMAKGGHSVEEHSHDGHKSSIQHGDTHEARQGHTEDTTGHHDDRKQGGARKQENSRHEERGGDHSSAGDGNRIKAHNSSDKIYTKGGDGHLHHQGDLTFSVEEGGIHYNIAKEFTVNTTGTLMHFNTSGDETHEVQGKTTFFSVGDVKVTSTSSITLQVGSSTLTMTPSGITLQVGSKGIQITSSDISITKTVYLGDSSVGAHDASAAGVPTKIP